MSLLCSVSVQVLNLTKLIKISLLLLLLFMVHQGPNIYTVPYSSGPSVFDHGRKDFCS
jgi:hypothetical protein